MKTVIGLVLMIVGVVLGIYLGIWVMFIGGIIQIAKSIQPEVIAMGIAWGIIRIFLASFVGWGCFIALFGLGKAMLD